MFVQVMEGKVSDFEAMRRRGEIWEQELRPGAVGFLGTTGGVTESGDSFVFARFDSEEAAHANSSRPEQGEWWAETERCYDGPVTLKPNRKVFKNMRRDPIVRQAGEVMDRLWKAVGLPSALRAPLAAES